MNVTYIGIMELFWAIVFSIVIFSLFVAILSVLITVARGLFSKEPTRKLKKNGKDK